MTNSAPRISPRLVEELLEPLPGLVREATGRPLGQCIATARIAQKVLDQVGISTRVVSVEVAGSWMESADDGSPEKWLFPLGSPRDDFLELPGWNGHLVLHSRACRLLIDPSASHFAYGRGFVIAPVVVAAVPEPHRSRWTHLKLPGGVEVSYRARPDNDAWQWSGSWISEELDGLATRCIEHAAPTLADLEALPLTSR